MNRRLPAILVTSALALGALSAPNGVAVAAADAKPSAERQSERKGKGSKQRVPLRLRRVTSH